MNYENIVKESFNVKYPEDTIFPSEIGICFRRSYLSRKMIFQKKINETHMDLGSQYHQHIENYLVEKLNCKNEIILEGEINEMKISARADLICGNDLLEIKTISHNFFQLKEYHLYQVAIYYYLLQQKNIKIDNVYIIYLNRETKEVKQLKIDDKLLQDYVKKAIEWIKKIKEYLNQTDYKKVPGLNNKFCTSCEFINYCYGKLF